MQSSVMKIPKLPIKQDDFFPYASDPHAYWTGYFTSRPNSKFLEAEANRYLQMVKQMSVLTDLPKNYESAMEELKAALGILQHHDAVTGTEKQHVTDDYVRLTDLALRRAHGAVTNVALNTSPTTTCASRTWRCAARTAPSPTWRSSEWLLYCAFILSQPSTLWQAARHRRLRAPHGPGAAPSPTWRSSEWLLYCAFILSQPSTLWQAARHRRLRAPHGPGAAPRARRRHQRGAQVSGCCTVPSFSVSHPLCGKQHVTDDYVRLTDLALRRAHGAVTNVALNTSPTTTCASRTWRCAARTAPSPTWRSSEWLLYCAFILSQPSTLWQAARHRRLRAPHGPGAAPRARRRHQRGAQVSGSCTVPSFSVSHPLCGKQHVTDDYVRLTDLALRRAHGAVTNVALK
ncbi:hypothetical protein ACJJTC_008706 [Scirpophaga incertulas]